MRRMSLSWCTAACLTAFGSTTTINKNRDWPLFWRGQPNMGSSGRVETKHRQTFDAMKYEKPYEDLREFALALEENGHLIRIQRKINKDTELHPLVRWPFRGLEEESHKTFLFENVTDSKGRKYRGSVLVGGLACSTAIYCLGLKCKADGVADRWRYAMDHPLEPEIVRDGPVNEEIHKGQEFLRHGGLWRVPHTHLNSWL